LEISSDRNGKLHRPTSYAALREHTRLDALITTIEYHKPHKLEKRTNTGFAILKQLFVRQPSTTSYNG
jgi:hypothetical protein